MSIWIDFGDILLGHLEDDVFTCMLRARNWPNLGGQLSNRVSGATVWQFHYFRVSTPSQGQPDLRLAR